MTNPGIVKTFLSTNLIFTEVLFQNETYVISFSLFSTPMTRVLPCSIQSRDFRMWVLMMAPTRSPFDFLTCMCYNFTSSSYENITLLDLTDDLGMIIGEAFYFLHSLFVFCLVMVDILLQLNS